MDMATFVSRLKGWLEVNAPGDLERFNPAATPKGIVSISENRFALHRELLDLLALHDGVRADRGLTGPGGFIPGGYFLLDAKSMRLGQRDMERAVAWSLEDNLVDFVVGNVAHVMWIPIAETHVGSQLVVDHREGPGFGSILEIDADAEIWGVKRWGSLAEMFETTYRALSDGTPVSDGAGGSIHARVIESPAGVPYVDWQ
ncbi:SMI1/KNR4 family protein [Streptomyces sp. G-G2]|uniref:SMI1/KNR4 family protein n=1 Tax=Streptomyces sp. G-G2 TaxID=3046201 RepID=UPI0024BAF4E7|nr:SMI1/KNR4 family protein [Streptomyces sp. G-G2]MDJ0386345.1 SMI1/KNR4 family protein [Streptomyces sp. G-G2]